MDGARLALSSNREKRIFELTQAKVMGAEFFQRKLFGCDDLQGHLHSLVTVASHAPQGQVFSEQLIAVKLLDRHAFAAAKHH